MVSGDSVSLSNGHNAGTFTSANAGKNITVHANQQALTGSDADNYTLNVTGGMAANISPKTLTASNVSATDKTYDGNKKDNLNTSNASLSGVVSGDSVSLSNGHNAGTFTSANAGKNITVHANQQALTGSDAGNYTLSVSGSMTATIHRRSLTASINGTLTKTYDGTTSATIPKGDTQLNGFVSGQGASSKSISGQYSQASAGNHPVSASLSASDFKTTKNTSLGNYSVPGHVHTRGTIKPKPLTATITGNPTKLYDGNKKASLTPADYTLNGLVAGQYIKVTQRHGTYAQASVGQHTVTASLASDEFKPRNQASLPNYVLPSQAIGTGTIEKQPNAIRYVPINSILGANNNSGTSGTNNNAGMTKAVYTGQSNRRSGFLNVSYLHIVGGGVCTE